MPGPIIADPRPNWLKPENASVFDSDMLKAVRLLAGLTGLSDPQSQLMGLMAPMETGPVEGLMGAIQKRITAFHGSPHDFNQFSAAKIGTGEGAQSYGHGLYFAENPETARTYRDALSLPDVEARGVPLSKPERIAGGLGHTGTPQTALRASGKFTPDEIDALSFLGSDTNIDTEIRSMRDQAAMEWRGAEARQLWNRRADTLERLRNEIKIKPSGKMYEVAIKADPEHFLDWDKPLKEQSEAVQQAVRRARDKAMGDVRPVRLKDGTYGVTRINADGTGNVIPGVSEATPEAAVAALQREADYGSGQWAYDSLSRTIRKPGAFPELSIPDKAAAANALKEHGIAGIKYLDQGSRAAGEGSRNYVVFDEKTIDILRKWAWILATGGGAATTAPSPQEQH